MTYYLAIDQGSQSSRALLFDAEGREIRRAARSITLNRPDALRAEHDAAELLDSVSGALSDLLSTLDEKTKQQIAACGLSTQRSTVLAWNTQGAALAPIVSWMDVRAASFVDSLRPHQAEIQRITGLPLSAFYGASKLRWLLTESDAVKNTKRSELRLSPLVSFLLYHLVEEKPYRVDHCNAQRTQLMSINTLDWSPQLSALFEVPVELLPACTPVRAQYGVLKNTSIPLTAASGDQNAAMLGVGELAQDTALINLGSGAFILRTLAAYKTSEKQLSGIAYSDASSVRYVREATINGAGSALSWLAEENDIHDLESRLPEWLASIDHPPLFINTVGGLGSPWWRQAVMPQFVHAEDMDNHGALAVAVVESIVFMLRANLDLMRQESPLQKLRVSGGLSASDGLCQKLANLCGLPVARLHNPEATARGIAWLAAGCPQNWAVREAPDIFEPRDDVGLTARYTDYLAVLDRVLARAG